LLILETTNPAMHADLELASRSRSDTTGEGEQLRRMVQRPPYLRYGIVFMIVVIIAAAVAIPLVVIGQKSDDNNVNQHELGYNASSSSTGSSDQLAGTGSSSSSISSTSDASSSSTGSDDTVSFSSSSSSSPSSSSSSSGSSLSSLSSLSLSSSSSSSSGTSIVECIQRNVSGAPVIIPIAPWQITNLDPREGAVSIGGAESLFDEQTNAGQFTSKHIRSSSHFRVVHVSRSCLLLCNVDPLYGNYAACTKKWFPGYDGSNTGLYPVYAIVDLRAYWSLTDIFLWDGQGQGNTSVHSGVTPYGPWTQLFVDGQLSYLSWSRHNVNASGAVYARYLRFTVYGEAQPYEFYVYGNMKQGECLLPQPVAQDILIRPAMDDFIGINAFIVEPIGLLSPFGAVREYHNWEWNEGGTGYQVGLNIIFLCLVSYISLIIMNANRVIL
jgi:hypothetical protein